MVDVNKLFPSGPIEGAMNVFIDTNILLNFYRRSKNELEELRKIAGLSKRQKIRLLISDYLKDEFYRNREGEIARSIKAFENNPTDWSIPNIFTAYPEFAEITEYKKKIEKAKKSLLNTVRRDIKKSALVADTVIEDLFHSSEEHRVVEEVLSLGAARALHRRTPGKRDSCGDAVHWEWLLSIIPKGKDLAIISGDGDFASDLEEDFLSSYLGEEWTRVKGSKCTLYTSLSAFLKGHFPQIKISEDVDESYAARLQESTRAMIEQFATLQSQWKPVTERIQAIYAAATESLNVKEMQNMFRLMSPFSPVVKNQARAVEKPVTEKKSE